MFLILCTEKVESFRPTASCHTGDAMGLGGIDATLAYECLVSGSATWTVDEIGFSMKGDLDYRWYRGYTTQQPSEYVFNAEVSKQILNRKATVSLKGYDIFGQAKNLTVTDSSNVHTESLNNTLGRYIIVSFTYRFGTFDSSKMRGPGRGPMGPPPGR